MSTRAVYTFIDPELPRNTHHVYKHHDGYPTGAAIAIANAQPYAWPLGRFEADEFAAAFVAGNKSSYMREELEILRKLEAGDDVELRDRLEHVRRYGRQMQGGGVRLMHSGSVYAVAPCDIEWRYEITSKKGALHVTCYRTSFWEVRSRKSEKREFKGTFEAFKAWGEDLERPDGCGAARLAVIWTAKSTNKKTGPMPVSTTSKDACAPDCAFLDDGCYAKYGPLGMLWTGMTKAGPNASFRSGVATVRTIDWSGLCANVKALPDGQIWRHNQAGDLPHAGGRIDCNKLARLVRANTGKRGFTYTHHNVLQSKPNRDAVADAVADGFTVNLSGNNLAHADMLADLAIAPVVVVLPVEAGREGTVTPKGRRVVTCPATYRDDVSCVTCQLCARMREVIVGFPAHGAGRHKAAAVAMPASARI